MSALHFIVDGKTFGKRKIPKTIFVCFERYLSERYSDHRRTVQVAWCLVPLVDGSRLLGANSGKQKEKE